MNKSLLDTDILSEIGKGIEPNVVRNATAYRKAFGRYTPSVTTIMEIVRGFQRLFETVRRSNAAFAWRVWAASGFPPLSLFNRSSASGEPIFSRA